MFAQSALGCNPGAGSVFCAQYDAVAWGVGEDLFTCLHFHLFHDRSPNSGGIMGVGACLGKDAGVARFALLGFRYKR